MEIRTNNALWNDKIEEAAKNIGETSRAYKIMHIAEAQKASKDYNRLMMFGIILGPASGIISGISAALNPEMNPTFPIIELILGFLSGIVVASIKFGRYDEVSNANKTAAARYTSIESNVRRQLGLNREDRMSPTSYMEWLETKYEELLLSAPLLPPGNYEKYKNTADKEGWIIPERYDHIISLEEGSRKHQIIEERNITLNPQETISSQEHRRSVTMGNIPELNKFSDQMLKYEMRRFEEAQSR